MNQLVAEVKKNPAIIEKAKKDPCGTIKEYTGVTVTPEQLQIAYTPAAGKVDMKQVESFPAQILK